MLLYNKFDLLMFMYKKFMSYLPFLTISIVFFVI